MGNDDTRGLSVIAAINARALADRQQRALANQAKQQQRLALIAGTDLGDLISSLSEKKQRPFREFVEGLSDREVQRLAQVSGRPSSGAAG
jgi:hypothetical protein